MAYEVPVDGMSKEARYMLYENSTSSCTCLGGEDPLEILMELEQLAMEEGYDNIHDFISQFLGDTK